MRRTIANELVLGDINGDGHVDPAGAYGGANKLWFGDGTGTFTEASASSFSALTRISNSLALADVDNDGDLDMIVGNEGSANGVYTLVAMHSHKAPHDHLMSWLRDLSVAVGAAWRSI